MQKEMETLRKNIKDANERVTKLIAENTTINETIENEKPRN